MAGNLKLRIDPPSKFSGRENYEEFSKKLRNYMCLSDLRYAELMTWSTRRTTEITLTQLRERDVDEQAGITEKLSSLFYYVLSGLMEGPAYTIVDQIEDSNGFEAWRRLHTRYARTKMQSAIMKLVTIVSTKFNNEKNFETTFAEWENDITKFEAAVGKELYDEIKVGLLIAGTTGKLHDHLCLTVTDVIDYESVRQTILHYFKSKTLTTSIKSNYENSGTQPMDVDAIKGKTKGKGKGKGKNKGPPLPPKGGDYNKGKGKGKGDQKGKYNNNYQNYQQSYNNNYKGQQQQSYKGQGKNNYTRKRQKLQILQPLQNNYTRHKRLLAQRWIKRSTRTRRSTTNTNRNYNTTTSRKHQRSIRHYRRRTVG